MKKKVIYAVILGIVVMQTAEVYGAEEEAAKWELSCGEAIVGEGKSGASAERVENGEKEKYWEETEEREKEEEEGMRCEVYPGEEEQKSVIDKNGAEPEQGKTEEKSGDREADAEMESQESNVVPEEELKQEADAETESKESNVVPEEELKQEADAETESEESSVVSGEKAAQEDARTEPEESSVISGEEPKQEADAEAESEENRAVSGEEAAQTEEEKNFTDALEEDGKQEDGLMDDFPNGEALEGDATEETAERKAENTEQIETEYAAETAAEATEEHTADYTEEAAAEPVMDGMTEDIVEYAAVESAEEAIPVKEKKSAEPGEEEYETEGGEEEKESAKMPETAEWRAECLPDAKRTELFGEQPPVIQLYYDWKTVGETVQQGYEPVIQVRNGGEARVISCMVNGVEAEYRWGKNEICVSPDALVEGKNRITVKVQDENGQVREMEPWEFQVKESELNQVAHYQSSAQSASGMTSGKAAGISWLKRYLQILEALLAILFHGGN